jgi:hypothetical protein
MCCSGQKIRVERVKRIRVVIHVHALDPGLWIPLAHDMHERHRVGCVRVRVPSSSATDKYHVVCAEPGADAHPVELHDRSAAVEDDCADILRSG